MHEICCVSIGEKGLTGDWKKECLFDRQVGQGVGSVTVWRAASRALSHMMSIHFGGDRTDTQRDY